MRAVDFFKLVWPTQGWYCIATPRKTTDGSGRWWRHHVVDDQNDAISYALQHGHTEDQYFAVLTLREPFVISESKLKQQQERGDKYPTGKTYRTHQNMAWARAYFLDLDVGIDDLKKYHDQVSAIAALKSFIKKLQLPIPLLVSSGRGIHVYWPLAEDIPSDQWKPVADKLKQLVAYHELKADPTRIADSASVLRVPGTQHLKDPEHPLPVRVIFNGGEPISFDRFREAVEKAMMLLPSGESFGSAVPMPESMMAQQSVVIGQIVKACAQIKHLIMHPAEVSEPQWYKLLGVVRFAEQGNEWAHKVSMGYPGYDASETNKKLSQLEQPTADGRAIGPSTCGSISDACGPERCNACWFRKTTGWTSTSSPLVAARRLPKAELEGIPSPPVPYARVEKGIMREGDDPILICPYDLYPVSLVDNRHDKKRASQWIIDLPRTGKREISISTETLNDLKLLGNLLGNEGFIPHYDETKWVQHYMKAYLRELQRYMDDHQQHTHLGWTNDRNSFVLPDVIVTNGNSKSVVVTDQVRTATTAVHKKGTMQRQIELMKFYDEPKYVRHQFVIGASLAAPLFFMSGHYGTVVNMTGESGASKSTAVFTAASMWGEPDVFTINGTNSGGTSKGKMNRVQVLSNLPFCVDELTNMDEQEAKHLVMGITQKVGPITLTQTRTERQQIGDTKSTLMLCNSNNSIHELLSIKNQAGTAGSMRLFEIPTPKIAHSIPDHIAKAAADDFMTALKRNYGWIGPEFIAHVTARLDKVFEEVVTEIRRIEALGMFAQAERFWSAVAGVTIYALKLAKHLGYLPFDPAFVEDWLVNEQLATMRTTVSETYTSLTDTLMGYISVASNGMVVYDSQGRDINILKHPTGEFTGAFERDARRVTIVFSHLKSWTARERIQLNALLRHVEASGIAKRAKMTIGRGTYWAKGIQPALIVDLKHPAISGHDQIEELDNVVRLGARK